MAVLNAFIPTQRMSPLPEFIATRKAIQQLPRDFYVAALAWMDAQPDSLVAARVMEVGCGWLPHMQRALRLLRTPPQHAASLPCAPPTSSLHPLAMRC